LGALAETAPHQSYLASARVRVICLQGLTTRSIFKADPGASAEMPSTWARHAPLFYPWCCFDHSVGPIVGRTRRRACAAGKRVKVPGNCYLGHTGSGRRDRRGINLSSFDSSTSGILRPRSRTKTFVARRPEHLFAGRYMSANRSPRTSSRTSY
jgi:hypothetical protein